MARPTNPVTPHLTVSPATEAIEFYKRAFGFEEMHRMASPDGKIMHCALHLRGAPLFVVDEFPMHGGSRSPKSLGGTTFTIHLDSPDVDAAFKRATDAGATPVMPPMDMFWGDRFCKVTDPFGHHWSIATHKEDLTPEEMQKRGIEAMKNWKPPKVS